MSTVNLVGHYANGDGSPTRGRVSVAPVPASAEIPEETVWLDDSGSFSLPVIATDSVEIPILWRYKVTVNLSSPRLKYSFSIEAPAGPDIDITRVTPVA